LIAATKHPQIHGHPTNISLRLRRLNEWSARARTTTREGAYAPRADSTRADEEMLATPMISLAIMSLVQTLAKDNSPDMAAPRAALLKRLEEVAAEEWLAVLLGSYQEK
jgi:hypothetical protein